MISEKTILIVLLAVLAGCMSDVRLRGSAKAFEHNEQLDQYGSTEDAVPVSSRTVYFKPHPDDWCLVGWPKLRYRNNSVFVVGDIAMGKTYPYSHKLKGESVAPRVRRQLQSLGLNLVDSEAEADFVLTMKFRHQDATGLELVAGFASIYILYPYSEGERCIAEGKLVDRRSGTNEVVVMFESSEGLPEGEKPIATDIAVHWNPVSMAIHTPINFIFKKDMSKASTYLDNQVINGYVSRVRQIERQGLLY